jgi:hypothetical protein
MSPAGFEPAIQVSEREQTVPLDWDRLINRISTSNVRIPKFVFEERGIGFPGEGNGSSFTNTEFKPTLYSINI